MTDKIYAVTMTVNERVHQLRTRSESVERILAAIAILYPDIGAVAIKCEPDFYEMWLFGGGEYEKILGDDTPEMEF